MSFENFQLPAFLLEDLYKDHLIDLTNSSVTDKLLKKSRISFLGSNAKEIAILVNEENIPFLEDEDLTFLTGILGACKLSLADVAIINCTKEAGLKYTDITEQISATSLLLFNVSPASIDLPLSFPHFQVQKYNTRQYLAAPSLKMIAGDKKLKQQLWESLKKIFTIA